MQRRDMFKSAIIAALGAVSVAASAQPGPRHAPAPRPGHRPPPPPPPRGGHVRARRGRDGHWYSPNGHRIYKDRYGVWRYVRDGRRVNW